ncbi:MAG: GIY-YIG nuclease family protein [Thermodesulfovibrionales bacterium]|nr:GIY-YIG nuclease family protein [Thermodesulfovibrionales bacterium]
MIEKLSLIPPRPGVYLLKGAKEDVLYVGKAKNLRNRLRSYFRKSAELDARKTSMMRNVRDISYVVTNNELEALVLEANLIKQQRQNSISTSKKSASHSQRTRQVLHRLLP